MNNYAEVLFFAYLWYAFAGIRGGKLDHIFSACALRSFPLLVFWQYIWRAKVARARA